MGYKESFYPESKFGVYADIDGTVVFFSRVDALLEPSFVLLDVGCGRGAYADDTIPLRPNLRIFKGKVAKVIGPDVDPDASVNPFLDEFHLIKDNKWPIANDSVDIVVCDNVMEHITDPDALFAEVKRVLKHGGMLCIRTPNKFGYPALMAKVIPDRYHAKVTSVVQDARKEEDVFPAVYRCNGVGKLKRTMKNNGFECAVYGYEAEPSYLSFSKVAYFMGVLHEKFAPRFMKPAIFAFGRIDKQLTRAAG